VAHHIGIREFGPQRAESVRRVVIAQLRNRAPTVDRVQEPAFTALSCAHENGAPNVFLGDGSVDLLLEERALSRYLS
jgi:hypothetical protein